MERRRRQARTGKRDPWQSLLGPFGLGAATANVVFESVADPAGGIIKQRVLQQSDYTGGHAIASAVHGLQSSFDLPVAIELNESDVRHDVIAVIEAGPTRWSEPDWMVSPERIDAPTAEQRLDRDLPLVVAAERRSPVAATTQRILVVGSGGWLLSYLADVVVPVGGNRMVLVNPGNYELLLASVAWLAGHDELIAPSPVSRQVSRLSGITPGVQVLWRWIAIVLAPGACLALGTAVWFVRRR